MHLAIFTWLGQGCLSFKIKMFLPAHLDPARQAQRGGGKGGCDVALGPDPRPFLEPAIGCQSGVDAQDRGFFGIGHDPQPRRFARGKVAGGDDQKNRLPEVMNASV